MEDLKSIDPEKKARKIRRELALRTLQAADTVEPEERRNGLDGDWNYFRLAGASPLLSKEEEKELALRDDAGDIEARKRLVESILRLVIGVARKYQEKGLSLLDLIQEGNIGLLNAIDKFDPKRGNRFSTPAVYWIRHAIGRAVADIGDPIRFPVYVVADIFKVEKTHSTLIKELGREPTDDEIAIRMGIDAEKVTEIKAVRDLRHLDSLDAPVDDEDSTVLEKLVLTDESFFDEHLVDNSAVGKVEKLLSTLDTRSRNIMEMRYGIKDSIVRSREEIAAMLSISAGRVMRLEKESLERMRQEEEA